jgi:hypothetical protein
VVEVVPDGVLSYVVVAAEGGAEGGEVQLVVVGAGSVEAVGDLVDDLCGGVSSALVGWGHGGPVLALVLVIGYRGKALPLWFQ